MVGARLRTMSWSSQFDWKFALRASLVIGLVFAALLSSWVGIEAERRGKEAVSGASLLARKVFDVSARAYELDALHDWLVTEQQRASAPTRAVAIRDRYIGSVTALRGELDLVDRMPLEPGERGLLQDAFRILDRHDQLVAELRAEPRRATTRSTSGAQPLGETAPNAMQTAQLVRALAHEVSSRVEVAAFETSEAGERAQILLIVFGSASLLLALYLARSLGEALAKAGDLMDRLAEMARIDGLTGLPNRRTWDEDLDKGLDRARRTGRPCTVGVIDLDHFKRYNDTHGHQAGDRLLRDAAQSLAQRMRAGDLIARYGGEEFAVLLHGCTADNALKFFERLHGAMPQGQTFSAGVSHTDGQEPGSDVLKRADEALYRAKSEGRDRTVAHQAGAAAA